MFGTCLSGRAHVHRGTRQVQTEPLPIIGSELAARSSAISNLMTLDPSVEELRGEKIPTYPLRFSTPELKPIPEAVGAGRGGLRGHGGYRSFSTGASGSGSGSVLIFLFLTSVYFFKSIEPALLRWFGPSLVIA
jgi:hypothetical protein